VPWRQGTEAREFFFAGHRVFLRPRLLSSEPEWRAPMLQVAVGIGAQVSIFDILPERLSYLHDITQGHITTCLLESDDDWKEIETADLVIGAVLIPGAKDTQLVSRSMLKKMQTGSAVVDISVDQGRMFRKPRGPPRTKIRTYVEEGIVHYGVANIPGVFPRTSTFAPDQCDVSLHSPDGRQGV